MASIGLRAAIAHAAVDSEFRSNLLANPAQACSAAGYTLGASELDSVVEVIGNDAFGVSAHSNLPALFEETSILVHEVALSGTGAAAPNAV